MKAILFCVILGSLAVASCHNNPTSPVGNGIIAGRISLHDWTSQHDLMSDFSGVAVRIDRTTYATVSDSNGYWEIDNVPAGEYDITATKPSFGTYHWYEQNLANGRLDLGPIALSQMSSFVPRLLWAGIGGMMYDSTGEPGHQMYIGYCDFDSTVQPSQPHAGVTIGGMNWEGNGCYFDYEALRTAGVRPGQTVYVSISAVFLSGYSSVSSARNDYYDPMHNETRWASTGPKSNVIAVIMP